MRYKWKVPLYILNIHTEIKTSYYLWNQFQKRFARMQAKLESVAKPTVIREHRKLIIENPLAASHSSDRTDRDRRKEKKWDDSKLIKPQYFLTICSFRTCQISMFCKYKNVKSLELIFRISFYISRFFLLTFLLLYRDVKYILHIVTAY